MQISTLKSVLQGIVAGAEYGCEEMCGGEDGGGVHEGVIEEGIGGEELGAQEGGVFEVGEEGYVDCEIGREVG